jgi:hypothetical protein
MGKSKRIEGPFTNEFGTFNLGDQCVAITVCTGRVNVARVEYIGYIERTEYNYQTKKSEPRQYAQIRRPSKRFEWYNKLTGESCSWESGNNDHGLRYYDTTTVTTLQYNRLLPAQISIDQLIEQI